jgi:purine-binding chemotaxis protein CheW
MADSLPADPRPVLRARALALARPPAPPPPAQATLLTFRLGAEPYAVDLAYVRKVYPVAGVTPLPGTPAFLRGLMNVQGQILAVLDLAPLLGYPPTELGAARAVVRLAAAGVEVGVLGVAVLGVQTVPATSIGPPLPSDGGPTARTTYLRGITADRLAVLDAGRLLADPQIRIDDPE